MGNIRRLIFATAAATAVFIQGCGCSDSKTKYYPPPDRPSEQTYNISGTGAKGILQNFEVIAYAFVNGVQAPLGGTTTNGFGQYSLDLPRSHIGSPILIQLRPSADGRSSMVCDLTIGCGSDVEFGEPFPVPRASDFTLQAMMPATQDNSVVNITLFTDLAARLALDEFSQGGNISDHINEQNSRVANRFGLANNLFGLPVIDLTNPAKFEAAALSGDLSHLRYTAINAGLLQASMLDNPDLDLAASLSKFVDYFTEEGGGIAGNTTDPDETSYADVIAAALQILERAQGGNAEVAERLRSIVQQMEVEQRLAESEEPDERSQGTPSEVSREEPLEKVKAMVEDLRNLAVSFGDVSVNGGTIGNIADDFAMQIEAAEMASSDDTSHVTHAMAIAAKAIDDANRAYSNNPERTSYTSEDGVKVTIAAVAGSARFSVDQEIVVATDDGDVTVEVVLDADNAMDYAGDREDLTVDGRYAVVGTAISAAISVEIKDGSSIAISNVEVVQEADEEAGTETQTETMDEFALNLQVEISQVKSDELVDPVTIKGALSVLLTNARVVHTEGEESTTARLSASILDLKLSGMVGNDSGESASFVVALNGDATGVEFVETWYEDWERETTETWEDEDNFSAFYGSIAFTAKLSGIPNAVVLNFNVARTGYENAENTLTIRYPGKQFRFHMLVADGAPDGALTITNHDGVVMSLVETEVDGENRLTGTISLDGVQYATIEDDRTITIHYSDDTFESL